MTGLKFCEGCNAKVLEDSTECEYCRTAIPKRSEVYPYAFAVGAGIAIAAILVSLTAGIVTFIPPSGLWAISGAIVPLLIVLPVCYYMAGHHLGYWWPDHSPWLWGFLVLAPLGIMMLLSGMVPGLLFILPTYIGARKGKKRRLRDEAEEEKASDKS